MKDIGWHFPLTNGGTEDGYNNPGMAHFGGSPLSSLARETIQNSLDARVQSAENVQVVFDVVRVNQQQIGRDQLRKHMAACLEVAKQGKNLRATTDLERALRLLAGDKITFLRVADYNTLGLDEARWKALVKSQGVSHKQDRVAGGSHGIGKYAPFVVSQLRTVFYWSESNGMKCCQGKAVLMSHDASDGRTQGTGFFGLREGCENVKGRNIPERIGDFESARSATGTSLWIAGFADDPGWQEHIARSVVESYFCAIAEGQLEVLIEPDAGDTMFEHWQITRETLPKIFIGLLLRTQSADDDKEALKEACAFYRALEDGKKSIVKEREDQDLGHCRLRILVEEGLPSKVGLIRNTGMLITSKQNKLLQFPGLRDFVAVLRFESEHGNELLREMENPAHDQFEPDRLDEAKKQRGKRALNRVVRWVREELRAAAAPPSTGTSEVVSELAHLLPDIEPDDAFGDGEGAERGFGASDVIQLRPVRRSRNASLRDESADDAGNDTRMEEGSAERSQHGDGDADRVDEDGGGTTERDGTGTTGGGRARQAVAFKDFRLLSQAQDGIRIAFTPTESAKAVRLDLAEAGDSNTVPRTDLYCRHRDGSVPLSAYTLDFVAGKRVVLEISGESLDQRAWQLQPVVHRDMGVDGQ